MTSKIFRSTLLVAAIVLLASLAIIVGVLYSYFSGVQVAQLQDELSLASSGAEQYGSDFLETVRGRRFRVTWVAADGKVLYDSLTDAETMENHADREEILEALETGTGSSARYSTTAMERTLYEAKRLSDGTVLRVSASQRSVGALLLGMFHPIFLVALIAIVLSALLARRIARRITEPLNRLDLEHPLGNDTYEELTPLLQRINRQHIQITMQMEALRRKADEFSQITENMQEGLVVLSSDGRILSINSTAKALFGAEDSCVGKSFFAVDPSQTLRDAVNAALDRGHGTARSTRNGREYQFDLSRIESDGVCIGAALLAFDITAALSAEKSRREFSANVSHELKTPLQSIIGSAELLENGMVKQEDTPRFVGHIRKEAARLVTLVEDIIRLSQLDEGAPMPTESVELLAMAREVAAVLETSAAEKQVRMEILGEPVTVQSVPRLVYEILYNLCDNAIKYNVPGGRVEITLTDRDGKATLCVADTGIGIPPEHRDRIFERFYRVDKSHSKQSGGTGLGLSIVKHAALALGAKVELQSVPNEGTTVTVSF